MTQAFTEHLENVQGTVRRVDVLDVFMRRRDISTYYWNNANDLNSGALTVWPAGPHTVFALLAGLSLELSLKAIAKILDRPVIATHRLNDLRKNVGISATADERALLDMLTEHIYWRSRYPVPQREEDWLESNKVFDRGWKKLDGSLFSAPIEKRLINLENYQSLWEKFARAYWRAKKAVLEP